MTSIKKNPEKVLILNKGGGITIRKGKNKDSVPIVISNMQFTMRLY